MQEIGKEGDGNTGESNVSDSNVSGIMDGEDSEADEVLGEI